MFRSVTGRLATEVIRQTSRSQSPAPAVRLLSTKQQHSLQNDDSHASSWKFPAEDGLIQKSPYHDIQVPNVSLDQYVWRSFREWDDKVAVVCGITGRSYTYAQMRDACAALAVRLQTKFDFQCGDRIGVCLPNSPEFPIAALGAIEAGLVVTTINPIYTADEIARQIVDSGLKVIIGSCEKYDVLCEAVKMAKKPVKIVCTKLDAGDVIPPGAIDFAELITTSNVDFNLLKRFDVKPDDVIMLPYSSGTTGMPKGVQLSHNNIASNCEMLQAKTDNISLVLPTTKDFQDVVPCVLPFFHIYGWTVTLISKLALGTKLVTLPKFHPETFLNALAEHKGTVLHLVPPIVIFLGHHDKVEKKHVENIRTIMSGAAPMGAPDAERFTSRAPGVEFLQGYGLTESSPVVLMGARGSKKYEAVGHPTPTTQAKIVALDDPKNVALGPNQVGELLVRGPQIMKGYLNNKKATDEIIVEGGWLRTGDLSFYDAEEGQFHITDRLKELIKVKGFQVPPAELEELIRAHPKVADAAVVGQSHPISGEVPRAFVVSKAGVKVTEDEIKEYVAKKVAVYKRLEGGVTFLETIPKNASGKILRRELKKSYC